MRVTFKAVFHMMLVGTNRYSLVSILFRNVSSDLSLIYLKLIGIISLSQLLIFYFFNEMIFKPPDILLQLSIS